MILTGNKIVEEGRITISDFSSVRVNPNSYNYRLGRTIKEFVKCAEGGEFKEIAIPDEGYLLRPRVMYLGVTDEVIGSSHYAMSLIGRSSLGRLGLFLQVSANLGHTTSCHKWTLELVACKPIIVYAGMNIGQVSFWRNYGQIQCFGKTYAKFSEPTEVIK